MRYGGETGFNAHARLDTHEKQIRGNLEANSMARHMAEEHPARRRDPTAFTFTVERAGERPLTRQMREAQKIANEAPGRLINGRFEHIPLPGHQAANPGPLIGQRGDARRSDKRSRAVTTTGKMCKFCKPQSVQFIPIFVSFYF